MNDSELEKIYQEGYNSSFAVALRNVFNAGVAHIQGKTPPPKETVKPSVKTATGTPGVATPASKK